MSGVILLLSTHCAHCQQALNTLSKMVKAGDIGQLEVINIEIKPEVAEQYHVRSVPWIKIGRFELTGNRSEKEIKEWVDQADSTQGLILQLNEWLTTGQLAIAEEQALAEPDYLNAIIAILQEPDPKINVRIGITVIIEAFQSSEELKELIPQLIQLSQHKSASVRADIAYYLGLTFDESVRAPLTEMLNDDNKDVREIAKDCLDDLA